MPDAVAVAIAKEVTAHLEGETYSVAITPERSYADWELALTDNGTLHVDVVAVTTEQKHELAARGPGKTRFTVPVDIAIRKRFDTLDEVESTGRINLEEIDALMLLTEEIYESLIQQRLTDSLSSIWQETKIVVAPDRECLKNNRQFLSVVRVTFEAHKAT